MFIFQLPATGFYITVMPIRIGGASGAPARVVAEITDEALYSGCQKTPTVSIIVLLSVIFHLLVTINM